MIEQQGTITIDPKIIAYHLLVEYTSAYAQKDEIERKSLSYALDFYSHEKFKDYDTSKDLYQYTKLFGNHNDSMQVD